jgi:hypothetical protein
LGEIESTLTSPKPFNPAQVDRTMQIATNDYGAFILIPPLMNRLQSIAPNINSALANDPAIQWLQSELRAICAKM